MSQPVLPPDGNRNRGPAVITIFWTECIIAGVFVALRFRARIMIRGIGIDDWIMLFTQLLLIILAALLTVFAANGGSRHLYYVEPDRLSTVLKYFWIFQPFGIMALGTSKISVGFLLLRLFPRGTPWRIWFVYVTMAFTFLVNALASIFSFVQCNPPRALWEPVPGAKCWSPNSQPDFSLFISTWNFVLDFCYALLPITLIWNLNMELKKKAGLCAILGLGFLAGVCGAIKVSTIHDLSNRADLTWATYGVLVWTVSEIFLLIVCGCVPTLKPLYEKYRGRWPSKSGYIPDSENSYPSKRSYRLRAEIDTTDSTPSGYRPYTDGNSTQVTGQRGKSPWADNGGDEEVPLREINVQKTVEVSRAGRKDSISSGFKPPVSTGNPHDVV